MQLKTVGESLNVIDTITKVFDSNKHLGEGFNDNAVLINKLGNSVKSYSMEAVKAALSQSNLTKEQIRGILSIKGLKDEALETEVALITEKMATDSLAKSQGLLKNTYDKVALAAKGLWATLKANPILWVVGAATALITTYNIIKQQQEELRQKTEEATDSYEEASSSIDDYVTKYQELHTALEEAKGNEEETYNIKKQLLELQTELNDKFGDEYGKINLVTDAYKDQIEVIKNYNKELAQSYLNENYKGIQDAKKEMTKERHYNLSGTENSQYTDEGAVLYSLAKQYEDRGVSIQDSTDGTFSIHLNTDAESAYEVINSFENDLREKAKELGDEHLFDGVLEFSSISLGEARNVIDDYGSIYYKSLSAGIELDEEKKTVLQEYQNAISAYNEAVLNSSDVYNDENVSSAREELEKTKNAIYGNEEVWGEYFGYIKNNITEAETGLYDFGMAIKNDDTLQSYLEKLKGFSVLDIKSFIDTPGTNLVFDGIRKIAERYGVGDEDLLDLLVKEDYVYADEVEKKLAQLIVEYEEAASKRKEFYSGENYVGNVDINNRPIVVNNDGTYSTTSTVVQEKWIGDEENGHYIIAHFTPYLPDGTELTEETYQAYIDKILNSDNPMEDDKPENGGYGIVYKVDTQVNGQEITDENLEDAFGIASAWDIYMHNLQAGIYESEGLIAEEIQAILKAKKLAGEDNTPSYINSISSINLLSKGLEQIDSIYADVLNKKEFDWSSILNNSDFKGTFGNMTNVTEQYKNAYDDFIATVSESPDNIKACQSAFDKLATAYIYDSGELDNLTKDTKVATTNMLEEKGISNADEIVNAYLTVAEAKREIKSVGFDLANITAEECIWLSKLGLISEETSQYLFYYQLQKSLSNENPLSTVSDCQQLLTLAENAGVTGDVIDNLNKVIWYHQQISLAAQMQDKDTVNGLTQEVDKLLASMKDQASTLKDSYTPMANWSGGAKTAAAAQSNLKDKTDATTKSLEKQKDALEKQKDALEEQKQHYDDVLEAINWFYDNQIDDVQDLIDELEKQNELIQEQIDLYDGALSAIERFYDKEIDAIQEKIDAMDAANDEAERQIALEKAQEALENARRNKSVRVYQHGKGFTYQSNQEDIKNAEDELASANEDITKANLQAQIDRLEKLRDLWLEIPNVKQQAEEESQMIELLGSNWEAILLEGRITNLEEFKDKYIGLQEQIDNNDKLIASYEEKIEYYESLKNQWEELTNRYQDEVYTQLLIGEFGNDYENELLNGRTARWDQFANDYYNTQIKLADITSKVKELAEAMEEYASRMEDAANDAEKAAARMAAANALANAQMSNSIHISGRGTFGGSAFAKGGIVTGNDKGDLDWIAHSLNEDHMVAVREGEAIIPADTVSANSEIIDELLTLNGKSFSVYDPFKGVDINSIQVPDFMPDYSDLLKTTRNVPAEQINNTTTLQFNGNLSFPNITSGNDAKKLISELMNLSNSALQRANKR